MTADDIFKIVSAITLIVGVGLTWRANKGTSRKDSFEELYRIIGLLKEDQKKLEERVGSLEAEKDALEDWARRLVAQLQRHGIVPVPFRDGEGK